LITQHLANAVSEATASLEPLDAFVGALDDAETAVSPFFKKQKHEPYGDLKVAISSLKTDAEWLEKAIEKAEKAWLGGKRDNAGLKTSSTTLHDLAERAHAVAKHIDGITKTLGRLVDAVENTLSAGDNENWDERRVRAAVKVLEDRRQEASEQLNLIRYFVRHGQWLQDRFPDAKLRDVEGLAKLVSRKELESHEWSLTPGRYVGVAPQEEDENFDFEETMRAIHTELTDLNTEASELAGTIQKNFEALA
jgi:type I restriction enzyme M protein